MARPRSLTIDRLALLAAITREWDADHTWYADWQAKCEAAIAAGHSADPEAWRQAQVDIWLTRRMLARLDQQGTDYKLGTFADRNDLTDSEAVTARKLIRQLAADGFLVLSPPHKAAYVKPTDAGRALVAQHATPAPASIPAEDSPAAAPDAPANE